jgi:hypothetical protein
MVLLCLLCFVGCSAPSSQIVIPDTETPVKVPAPRLNLIYKVGNTVTYRLSQEVTRSVQFEGIRPDDKSLQAFAAAITGRLSDVTWTQTVQAVDPNGQALMLIEITGLTYQAYKKGDLVVDYDSASVENTPAAFEDLCGLQYRIRMDAKGQVVQVSGEDEAFTGLDKNKAYFSSAKRLVSKELIKTRHSVKALDRAPDHATKNETWAAQESYTFGQMGKKQFEKTYTCLGKDADASQIKIRMTGQEGLDSSLSIGNSPMGPITSEGQFAGTLIFDIPTGQIKTYHETLEVDWVFTDPTSMNEPEPRKGHMIQRQAFLLDRKDAAQ